MRRLMRLDPVMAAIVIAAIAALALAAQYTPGNTSAAICFPSAPKGGIPPQVPEWCDHQYIDAGDTHVEGSNAWLDEFNHGESHKELSAAYAHGEANGEACDIVHFSHNNHWMADVQGQNGPWPTMCAAWMRPDRLFTVQPDGTLVIEFEVASPIAGTRNVDGLGDAWPEFTVSTDPSPGNLRQNGTYMYETMAGHWTFGCRMQQSKHPICSLYEPEDGPPAFPYRRWEINQNGGDVASEQNGGDHVGTGDAIDQAWVGCTSTEDPDTKCRNHHRIELTKDGIKFFVNGVPGYSAVFENDDMDNLLGGPVYVYFGDFAYLIENDVVVRFHWDRLAINPALLPSDAPPMPSPTATPAPTATPTPSPTPTPTATATPPQTITFNDRAGQNIVMPGGPYPAGVINWFSNQWFLSGPWGAFTTKSVSFTSGRTSSNFTFIQPKRLVSLQAYNGGAGPTTVTISCVGGTSVSTVVAAGQMKTIPTGFASTCSNMVIGSTNGWDTNFDNLVISD